MSFRSEGIRPSLAILLGVYVLARYPLIGHFRSPVFGWRPAELAGIALEYYRNGFHFFHPQVLWGGSGPGYVEMEFPIVPFTTALLFRLFGVHEQLCLVVPLAVGFGLVWVTYSFARYMYDEGSGLMAGMVVAVAPTLRMMTIEGLYPDPPMVLFGTLALYLLARWVDTGRTRDLVLGSLSVAFAILLKMTALILGLLVLYLLVRKHGRSWWRHGSTWGAAALMLLPPSLWYWHAHQLYVVTGNTFGIVGAGYSKFSSLDLLVDPRYYVRVIFRMATYQWTPVGALGCGYGAVLTMRRKSLFPLVWLAALGLYVLFIARGITDGHYAYLLPALPVGAILGGLGLSTALARIRTTLMASQWVVVSMFALLFAANVVVASEVFEIHDRPTDSVAWEMKKVTGLRVARVTAPGSLLIVVDSAMDERTPQTSMTPPDVFYFGDRRGWYRSLAWLNVAEIERLHEQGASYFVVSGQSVSEFKIKRADIFAYLSGEYEKIVDDDEAIVFALGRRHSA
jgi:4-amino-4-deoxy-L-arabinose transferase-like glycosyltransferase